jgi:hypothetical protein
LTKFDIGIAAGLEYKLKKERGMGLGMRYYYGFTDMQKTSGAQHNSVFTLNVSIRLVQEKQLQKQMAKSKDAMHCVSTVSLCASVSPWFSGSNNYHPA